MLDVTAQSLGIVDSSSDFADGTGRLDLSSLLAAAANACPTRVEVGEPEHLGPGMSATRVCGEFVHVCNAAGVTRCDELYCGVGLYLTY